MGRAKRPDFLTTRPGEFPNRRAPLERTSPTTSDYNCIAWAAGDRYRWWEPSRIDTYWPAPAPNDVRITSLVAAFEAVGFRRSSRRCPRRGEELIALYYDPRTGEYTHAARRRKNGKWASKLGHGFDVHHSAPECLTGSSLNTEDLDDYGAIYCYMSRPLVRGDRARGLPPNANAI